MTKAGFLRRLKKCFCYRVILQYEERQMDVTLLHFMSKNVLIKPCYSKRKRVYVTAMCGNVTAKTKGQNDTHLI